MLSTYYVYKALDKSLGKYEKIKMKCIILLLIELLVKKRNDKIIGGLVLRGESKCDKATGNVTEVQTGSCHSSYTQADILSFLLNCVCLVSLVGGAWKQWQRWQHIWCTVLCARHCAQYLIAGILNPGCILEIRGEPLNILICTPVDENRISRGTQASVFLKLLKQVKDASREPLLFMYYINVAQGILMTAITCNI